jgi:hypothetical protein
MNRMLKLVLIAGAALILSGGLVYGAAHAIGERRSDSRTTSLTHTFPSNRNISSLRIDGMVAKVNIKQNTENEIKIDAHDIIEEHFKYEIEANGTLRVSYSPNWKNFNFINIPGITKAHKTPVIDIYIPEGMVFENVNIDGGVGEYNIEYINAGNFKLDGGVGKITVRGSRIDKLKIDGGVGEYKITGDIGEMDISSGVGKVTVSGSVARDIKLNGGVGEIRLDLTGDINAYDVRANTGVGTIRINGEKADHYRNSGAQYRLTADGGVGTININIK